MLWWLLSGVVTISTLPVGLSGWSWEILEPMDRQRQLGELLDLAERVGVEVRQVDLGGEGGGLCVLRGQRVLFVDVGASVADQVGRTAEGLASLGELEEMYVLPEVREVLAEYQGGGGSGLGQKGDR